MYQKRHLSPRKGDPKREVSMPKFETKSFSFVREEPETSPNPSTWVATMRM